MIEVLIALVAGLIGGLLSRYIPAFPKRLGKPALVELGKPGKHSYEVRRKGVVLYIGPDLVRAKMSRTANPGAVLIADGVNRG